MATNIHTPIKDALAELRAERDKLDRQIDALEGALAALGVDSAPRRGRVAKPGPVAGKKTRKPRQPLTPSQRKAISVRMKAAWARRRRANA